MEKSDDLTMNIIEPPLWIHETLIPCDEEESEILLQESIRRLQNGK